MRTSKKTILVFVVLILVSALYRIVPFESRPTWLGAPQLALAIFAGALISRKGLSFLVVLLSMLVGDVLMQAIHIAYPSMAPGFYSGQWVNYILIGGITAIGFLVKANKVPQIFTAAIASPIVFFLLSNLAVWASGGGLHRPFTFGGLFMSYADGLPFLWSSMAGTVVFSAFLFGAYHLYTQKQNATQLV